MIADIRASTPSNAIERVVPIKDELLALIAQAQDRLDFAIDNFFVKKNEKISSMILRLSAAPMKGISNATLRNERLKSRLSNAVERQITTRKNRLLTIESILKSTNPERVLQRGYSMALNENGKPVTSIAGLKQGDPLTIVLKDGKVQTEVKK